MPIYRAQCSFQRDSLLPRDAFVITPHFNDQGVGTDPQGLADDLADGLAIWVSGSGTQIEVKLYDAQGPAPHYPAGEAVRNLGNSAASSIPREVALCLSFFGTRNVKRQRGRLFVPTPLIAGTVDVRPSAIMQGRVAELVPIFTGLGGADVDWCVFSRLNNAALAVTDWWVDNEWDTIRSRGLRATSRITGQTTE